jgi:hypothetical protein
MRLLPGLDKGALVALVREPALWPTAFAEWRALVAPGWWRRWPPLPWPAPGYLSFRLEAMYGSASRAISGQDLVSYLKWCRSQRAAVR